MNKVFKFKILQQLQKFRKNDLSKKFSYYSTYYNFKEIIICFISIVFEFFKSIFKIQSET